MWTQDGKFFAAAAFAGRALTRPLAGSRRTKVQRYRAHCDEQDGKQRPSEGVAHVQILSSLKAKGYKAKPCAGFSECSGCNFVVGTGRTRLQQDEPSETNLRSESCQTQKVFARNNFPARQRAASGSGHPNQ
jgi:hypothetical protein